MSPALVVVLSGTLTFGVPLIVAVREVLVTRRGGGGWRPERLPEPRPVKPLPSCLLPPPRIPNADAPRSRVLEDA